MLENTQECDVSVIIPIYNGADYFPECIESVINQTLSNIEVIIINDGSTDETASIIKKYQKKDHRIKIINKEHSNAGDSRNAGMAIAQGKYLSFLDADDIFSKEMLESCFHTMEMEASDIAIYSASEYNMRTNMVKEMPWSLRVDLCPEHSPFHPSEMSDYLFNAFQNWPWNKMFRKSFVQKHNIQWQSISRTNDLAFTMQALTLAERISVINQSFVKYRIGTGTSLQQTNHMTPLAFWDAFREAKRRMISDGTFSFYEKSYLRSAMSSIIYNYESISDTEAKKVLFNYIRSHAEEDFGFSRWPREFYLPNGSFDKFQKIMRHIDSPIKVSVVLPSLNVAPYIRECIESAINQTMREIEIICVDAGSTDGTLDILEEYAQKDSRIRILHSPVKSYGHQMNLGLDAARGEYFAILETDDYIKPLMFEELYQLAEDNFLDIIKPDYSIFVTDENDWKYFTYQAVINTRILSYNRVYTPADNLDTFKAKNFIWTGLYDLEFLRANQIRFHESPGASYQDNGFWFLTMCHAHRIMFYERDYYMLRRDNPNSSVHSRGKVFCICDEYDYIRNELRKEPDLEAKFAPVLALYRFKNYEWNYRRIGDEFKDEFLERFSSDFKALLANGEIHGEYFDMEESFRLRMILEAPVAYKYHRLAAENRENTKTIKVSNPDSASNQLKRTKHDLDCVHRSVSFRLGRAITWLPRKVRGGVRCFTDHGWKYTLVRLLFYMGLVKDNEPDQPPLPVSEIQRDYHFYSGLHRDYYRTELMKWYEVTVGSRLNLNYPKTYNEKIQWLKLYDSTPQKTMLSDKYLVREYVAETIGEEYLVPLLGVWDKFEDIDFSQLPDRFVLKTNHGCGTNFIVTNKEAVDLDEMRRTMNNWLSVNYAFKNGFELQYMNIQPRIIAEEYLENAGGDLKDYKVFCFNGKADCIMYLSDRKKGLRMAFFDLDWNKLDYTYSYPRIEEDIPCPPRLKELIELAEKLSKGFAHVRVDFYVLNDGRILFGEMTFTSASGKCKWSDQSINERFGEMITLPIKSPIPRLEGMEVFKRQAMGNTK